MRKSDFGAIHCAIAHTLEEGEIIRMFGIEDDLVHGVLCNVLFSKRRACWSWAFYLDSVHGGGGSVEKCLEFRGEYAERQE